MKLIKTNFREMDKVVGKVLFEQESLGNKAEVVPMGNEVFIRINGKLSFVVKSV